MSKVLIPLTDGFEDIEAVSVIDVLRRGGVEVVTASCMRGPEVVSAHGIAMKADEPIDKAVKDKYDAIVLPGGPGTRSLLDCAPLVERLRSQKEDGGLVCAICAAPTVFGKLGLLEDKKAICYPGMEDQLTGARVTYEPAVRDGNIITSRGMGTAIDFGLEILAYYEGREAAAELAEKIVYEA